MSSTPSSSSTTSTPPSSGATTTTTTTPPASTTPAGATAAVAIQGFAFRPEALSVAAGTTVTWTNEDGASHTVAPDGAGGFGSGTLAKGSAYSFTFSTPGTFAYHCGFHESMTGTATVA